MQFFQKTQEIDNGPKFHLKTFYCHLLKSFFSKEEHIRFKSRYNRWLLLMLLLTMMLLLVVVLLLLMLLLLLLALLHARVKWGDFWVKALTVAKQ